MAQNDEPMNAIRDLDQRRLTCAFRILRLTKPDTEIAEVGPASFLLGIT